MDEVWKSRLLQLKYPHTEADAQVFVALVDQAKGHCTPDTVAVLMKTFSSEPDYGVQESVISTLSTADPEAYVRALLEELPRLILEAPDWADVLVSHEVELAPERLVSIAKTVDVQLQECLRAFVGTPTFLQQNENADLVFRTLTRSGDTLGSGTGGAEDQW